MSDPKGGRVGERVAGHILNLIGPPDVPVLSLLFI